MAAKEAPKTRMTFIQKFRKRISGIRGGRQRPLSPASVLDFPADDFPLSSVSSPTISDVLPTTTVPYDPDSMVVSLEPSMFLQQEVLDETVDIAPPSQTPNVTIHIENKVSLKTLSASSKAKARTSSNVKTDEVMKAKQKLFSSPLPELSEPSASVPHQAAPASMQHLPSSSIEDETDPAPRKPPNAVTDKHQIICPVDLIDVSPSPITSVEAAKANSTTSTDPTAAASKPDRKDALIGRKVRILKHPKKCYMNKVGHISKEVRKNTYTVEFDDTDLHSIDKTFKTMELLPADVIEPEQALTRQEPNLDAKEEDKPTDEATSSSSNSKRAPPEGHSTRNSVARSAASKPAVNTNNTSLVPRIGQKVKILRDNRKKYVGKIGLVQQQVAKNRFLISFSDLDPIKKQPETLEILEDQQSVVTLFSSPDATGQSRELQSVASNATKTHRGVPYRSQQTSTRVSRGQNKKPENPFQSGEYWRVPNAERGGIRIGRRRITKIRTTLIDITRGTTLLSHLLGNRVLPLDNPISEFELEEPFDRNLEVAGRKYELVATKVHIDGDKGSALHCKPKLLRLTYAEVEGPSMEDFSMADHLERLANFAALEPRKAKARLELLQSPAHMLGKNQPAIFHLPDNTFTTIQDNGESQGCGFISEQLLESMFRDNAQAKRIIQIQVRIIAPKLGLFKGTLKRARGVVGIHLFPSSMRKVPASIHPNAFDGGIILVCQGGVHPSPINEYIGRRLDPNAKPPPEKSFKSTIKPLSDMILRLWLGMGVPRDVCSVYAKNSRSTKHINHAWVCGAADFSNHLPPGHVFVTGLTKANMNLYEIFVTRSPCMEPTDGRMLPLVKSRPEGMSIEDWEWLNNLTFGSIIFANPPEGMKTLPEHIADGDLDGDRYFICWDPSILGYIRATPIVDEPVPLLDKSTGAAENNPDWFEKAQDWMLASSTTELKIQQLTGTLFSLSNKIADESPLYNNDPDAIASAAAYKQALDVGKHGGPIFFPAHLHDKLPEALRPYVIGTQ